MQPLMDETAQKGRKYSIK